METTRVVRWLCRAIVVFAIGSALLTLGSAFNVFGTPPNLPESVDFVARILAARTFDQSVAIIDLTNAFLTLGLFLFVALLGAALRPLIRGAGGDLVTVAFAAAGVVGVISQLVNIGLDRVAESLTYCDCGYKTYEVIGQAKALDVGFVAQAWLNLGAVGLAGLATVLAGRLLDISPTWRWISYLIGILAAIGIALNLIGQDFIANVFFGVALAFVIPIWAILLARGVQRMPATAG